MVEDNEATRLRIYDDVMAASDGGARPLSRDWLLNYSLDGARLPLIDAQGRGIRNRDGWHRTLSITTKENGKYQDREIARGVWRYPYSINKHGAIDPSNTKLARAVVDPVPILYFYKPVANTYLAIGLVVATENDHVAQEFTIALTSGEFVASPSESELERQWIDQVVSRRLHQPRFREIVLEAYSRKCAICALPDASLLDAAHIRGDKDLANGQPWVENGLALCAIHHRAYDGRHIGIDEDLTLHVRADVLAIADGPVLEYAIQRLPGTSLTVVPPRGKRPDPYRLGLTFKEFLAASPS